MLPAGNSTLRAERCGKERSMYHSIMVPLDGSAFGEHALPLALTIARRAGGLVNLAHVSPGLPPGDPRNGGRSAAENEALAERQRSQTYLDHLTGTLSPRWELPITSTLLEGAVADALHRHVLASDADLVVMTTHGYGPLSRFWMGSVADRLVRIVQRPILLTRPRSEALDLLEHVHEHAFQHMLIPLDGSPLSETAIEPSLGLARLMGADVTLLQAVEVPVIGYAPAAYAGGLDLELLEECRTLALGYLNSVANRLQESGLRVHTDVVVGHPATAILEYGQQHAIDLFAMATHGRGGAARILLGSTADKIVRGATVPVLLNRPPAA
jgi:nucleotide-binding universal stress UspA family protein